MEVSSIKSVTSNVSIEKTFIKETLSKVFPALKFTIRAPKREAYPTLVIRDISDSELVKKVTKYIDETWNERHVFLNDKGEVIDAEFITRLHVVDADSRFL